MLQNGSTLIPGHIGSWYLSSGLTLGNGIFDKLTLLKMQRNEINESSIKI